MRPQPLSDEETLQGAINRAKDCLKKTESALAIGLEAGVVFMREQVYLCHWGAIVDRDQNTYFTNGPLILLHKEFLKPLLDGQNLEDIMHYAIGIPTVNEHLKNIYQESELDADSTIRKFRIVRREGAREVAREIEHYNLDAILAVGYRVRSDRGVQFRRWATERR